MYIHKQNKLILEKIYLPQKYSKYDYFDAINVDRVADIPIDYPGIMGVPISYLGKHCPNQFKIVGVFNHGSDGDWDLCKCAVNGKEKFKRLAIQKVN